MHQISAAGKEVSSPEFAFWAMFFKAVICDCVMLILRKKIFLQGDFSKAPGSVERRELSEHPEKSAVGKKILPLLLISSVADGISYMLQLIGAVSLPASVLYPFITGGGVVFTSLADVVLFHEKLSGRQVVGVLACFIGTLLFMI